MKNQYPWLDAYLLEKPGGEKDYKAEWEWFRYRVREKMYAAVCEPDGKHPVYGGHMLLNLKCDPQLSVSLRGEYPQAVLPGFYCDKTHWISVLLDGELPEDTLRALCDMSYGLVLGGLPKKVQREILEEQNG